MWRSALNGLAFLRRPSSSPAGTEHRWSTAAMKITNEGMEGYLNCKSKGHLKFVGESGTPPYYETMTTTAKAAARTEAVARLVAQFSGGDACQGLPVTAATLKQR